MSSSSVNTDTKKDEIRNLDEVDACRFVAPSEKDKIVIIPPSYSKTEVSVHAMYISLESDTYQPGRNYGGVIIYQYNGKSEWRTANNTRCCCGCIVIQNTDSENVRKWMEREPGVVHGAVFKNAFGESVNDAEIVGEGFAIRNGKFAMHFGVFNNPVGSVYHDQRKRMHELSEHCVRTVVESWKMAGTSWYTQRHFEVRELLKNFQSNTLQRHV